MYAEFTENLATGNEMIDSQHKELIQKINNGEVFDVSEYVSSN